MTEYTVNFYAVSSLEFRVTAVTGTILRFLRRLSCKYISYQYFTSAVTGAVTGPLPRYRCYRCVIIGS